MTSDAPFAAWMDAVRQSHRRLTDVVAPLTPAQVAGPSYDTEWSIAQVLSHLGSGAEIFTLFLDAGAEGREVPGPETFQSIWAAWNGKAPAEQARDALVTDGALIDRLEALDTVTRERWRLAMFGTDRDLRDLLRLRLGEHALHTWDIEVVGDPSATVAPDAVELLVDTLPDLAGRVGKPTPHPLVAAIDTDRPDRQFVLRADDQGTRLEGVAPGAGRPSLESSLRLPAEALIRLVYGRLDERHAPPVETRGVSVDELRPLFPGF